MFCNSDKECISTDTVNMMFKCFCRDHNIGKGYDVHQHMLRHTFATRCIEAGMPAAVLAKIMGHANVATTLNVTATVTALRKIFNYISKLVKYSWNAKVQ